MESEFEGGAELQAHVLHHGVATQQQQGFAVDLLQQRRKKGNWPIREGRKTQAQSSRETYMFSEKVSVGGKQRVNIPDEPHDIIDCPEVGVSATRLWASRDTAYENTPQGYGILMSPIYGLQHIVRNEKLN